MLDQLNELAFYGMAGAARDPKALLADVRDAERIGLGSVFLSERFNVKEAVTLCGAVGAATTTLGMATGVTNHNTRHPIVTASFATTMDKLTDGRFALGLGRGIAPLFKAFGLPSITTAQLEDFAGLMRNLWQNEMVFGHNGPAGNYPFLRVDWGGDGRTIPLMFTAFGPNSLALGGRVFDGVILHTFFTDDTLARCVAAIRDSAEKAGRDPDGVRIWSCLATVGDHIPYELRLKKTVGRMATYLQAYGDLMVETNNWDPSALAAFRASDAVTSIPGAIDDIATTEQLERVAEVIPAEWLAPAATGSADQCVDTIQRQFELGATGVILHGATPVELEPIVEAYRARRKPEQFAHLSANPTALNRDLAGRSAQLLAGLIGVGAGVALMVDAGVGLSPWDVLHQGLSKHTGYAIGTVAIALGLVVFLAWIPLKQRIGVGTVINVLTIGITVNLFLDVDFAPHGWSRYAWSVLGVVIISVAGGVYIGAGLGTGPRDGLMTGLVDRGLPLRTVRTVLELTVLAIGWLLGGNVGFGTVLFAVTVGPILHVVLHRVDRGRYRDAVLLDDHDDAFPPPAVS